MINELIQSVRQGLDERVRNPLPGAFLIAWCVCNWKIIAVLFGGGAFDQKMISLDRVDTSWTTIVFIPLGLAVAYVFIMPWLAFGIQKYNLYVNNKRKMHKLQSETALYAQRIRNAEHRRRVEELEFDRSAALEEAKHELQNQIDEHEFENRRLSSSITVLEKERDSFKSTQGDDEQELQAKIATLTASNEQLTETKNNNSNTVKSLKDQLKAKRDEVQTLTAELAEVKAVRSPTKTAT